ncbi:MAG TPA: hypothetical protein VF466_02570 [Candidatus Saccharimonadales bacterium]
MRLTTPTPELATPVAPVLPEAVTTPEAEPRVGVDVGMAGLHISERPGYAALPDDERDRMERERSHSRHAATSGRNGVYFVGNSQTDEHGANYTTEVAQSLFDSLDAPGRLDGADNNTAEQILQGTIKTVNDDLHTARGGDGSIHDTGLSLGVVRVFRGEDDKNRAGIVSVGGVRVLRVRGEDVKELTHPSVLPDGSPLRTVWGEEERPSHSDEVQVVDVELGDRFIITDTRSQRSSDGDAFSRHAIAEETDGLDAQEAAEALVALPDKRAEGSRDTDHEFEANLEDAAAVVLDVVEEQETSGRRGVRGTLSNLKDRVSFEAGQQMFKAAGRRAVRAMRVRTLRAEYKANPTAKNRAKYIGSAVLDAALTTGGILLIAKFAGIGAHGLHDVGMPLPGDSHSPSPSTSPFESHSPSASPFDSHSPSASASPFESHSASPSASASPFESHSASASASASASGSASAHPSTSASASASAYPSGSASASPSSSATAGNAGNPNGGGNVLNPNNGSANNDPNAGADVGNVVPTTPETGDVTLPHDAQGNIIWPDHLPEGVKISDEQMKWLESNTGGGPVGAYDGQHLPADGTGYKGTVWHASLDGLKQLGYDPSKMSEADKTAYVQHVLDQNHLTWDSAKQIGDNYNVHVPTNADAIKTITEITAKSHDGHPLLPADNSVASQHLQEITKEIQTQTGGNGSATATNPGTNPGGPGHVNDPDNHIPGTRGNGTPTPSTSASASPSASASASAAAQPSGSASASASPSASGSASAHPSTSASASPSNNGAAGVFPSGSASASASHSASASPSVSPSVSHSPSASPDFSASASASASRSPEAVAAGGGFPWATGLIVAGLVAGGATAAAISLNRRRNRGTVAPDYGGYDPDDYVDLDDGAPAPDPAAAEAARRVVELHDVDDEDAEEGTGTPGRPVAGPRIRRPAPES